MLSVECRLFVPQQNNTKTTKLTFLKLCGRIERGSKAAELTISCRGGGRNQFRRRITAHFGSHQVDLCAAAGVGADLCMLVEVQFPRVHDLPVKLKTITAEAITHHHIHCFTDRRVWQNSAILSYIH